MALIRHDQSKRDVAQKAEVVPRRLDFFDRFFDEIPDVFRRPILLWPERSDALGIEEFTEDGALVVRMELPGIDPEKDLDVSVSDGVLHVAAERREDEEHEGRDYVRREFRYGSFHRDLALPKGSTESEVNATYRDGILEIRVSLPKEAEAEPRRIAVSVG